MKKVTFRNKKAIHFSLDGLPWPSPATDKIWKDEVLPKWEELKKENIPMWLVSSQHWTSQGWWIEFKEPKLSALDCIIYKHIPA